MTLDEPKQPFQADEAITAVPEGSDIEDVLSLNQAAAEIAAFDDALVEATQTTDTFIELDHALAQSVSEGGLDVPAAQAIRMAVEQMVSRMEFPVTPKPFPSMENFKDPHKRVQATKVAMEGLRETAAAILEGIIKVCKRVLQTLSSFIDNALRGWGSLRERAKRLQALIKERKGWSFSDATLIPAESAGRFSRVLCDRGEFKGAQQFSDAYGRFTRIMDDLRNNQNAMLDEGMAAVSFAEAALPGRGAAGNFGNECLTILGHRVSGVKMPVNSPGRGFESYELKLPFGDRSFWSVIPDIHNLNHSSLSNVRFEVGESTHYRGPKEIRGGVEPLGDDSARWMDRLIKAIDDGEKRAIADRDRIDRTFEKYIGVIQAKQKAMEGKEGFVHGHTQGDWIIDMTKTLSKIITQGMTSLASYEMTVYRASLEYVAASLALAEKPAAS